MPRFLAGPVCPLQYRILFNVAHKFNDEAQLVRCHKELDIENPKSPIENQLCFAAIYFLRNHFEEASDTYKRLSLEHPSVVMQTLNILDWLLVRREMLALNVYMAFCYFKMDYYDLSMEMLNKSARARVSPTSPHAMPLIPLHAHFATCLPFSFTAHSYLQVHPRSAVAVNLKACNQFKLYRFAALYRRPFHACTPTRLCLLVLSLLSFLALPAPHPPDLNLFLPTCAPSRSNGKTAEQEYKVLADSDGTTEAERSLIEHNKAGTGWSVAVGWSSSTVGASNLHGD